MTNNFPEDNNNSALPQQIEPESSTKDHAGKPLSSNTSLTIPPRRISRRTSVESAFSGSDISELSFGSTEIGSAHDEGLLPILSNASSTFASIPVPSTWRSKLQEFWISNYGAFLVLLSQVFGCMMNISTRVLETPGPHGKPMHPFQILFVRQFATTLITSIYVVWSKSVPHFPLGPPGRVRLLLVARGLFGFFGVFGLYFSLLYLPISEATVLTFLATIGACYAYSLLLPGETFSRQQQLAGFISLIGVVFIARPASLFHSSSSDDTSSDVEVGLPANGTSSTNETSSYTVTSSQRLQAVGVAMIGVAGTIIALTAIRAIGTRAHALISVNYFSAWCTFVSLMALLILPDVEFRLPGNALEWGLLSILGCCGFIMQFLLTQGLAYGAHSTDKNGTDTAESDIEMQTHGGVPQGSDSSTSAITRPHPLNDPAKVRPYKGSGAKATSMLYTQMLFALIADKVIFSVTPTLLSWIGSGFILSGAIWVAADSSKRVKQDVSGPLEPRRERTTTPSKQSGNERAEEVGLLADVDEPIAEQENAETSSSADLRLEHG